MKTNESLILIHCSNNSNSLKKKLLPLAGNLKINFQIHHQSL